MKIHIFASDVLPLPGLPTSGGGLRSWQLLQGLRRAGLEVSYSMPKHVFLGKMFEDAISPTDRELAWDFDNQVEILEKIVPDVAIWCNSPTIRVPFEWNGGTRLIADLHGPINIESAYVTDRTLEATTEETVERLRRFDGFSCVSERQRYYWTGLLCSGDILIDEVPFVIAPMSVEPDDREKEFPEELRLIYAGGFYPWQNCIDVLLRIGEVLDREEKGRLDLFGGVHEFSDTEEFRELFEKLKAYRRVHCHGFVSRDELMKYYRQASCAVDVMHKNIERELAVTTRTVEYLALGIPPLYNNYNVLSNLIEKHRAGWCLDPENLDALEAQLLTLLQNPVEGVREASRNAKNIYGQDLTIQKTVQPLADLCRTIEKRIYQKGRTWGKRIGDPTPHGPKPFHKRFYYAWQALRGKQMKVMKS